MIKDSINVLLLEDAPLDAELIKRELIKGGIVHALLIVRTKRSFQEALENFPADIILSDHSLPGFSSHEALKMSQAADLDIPFILITATMTDDFAARIMKDGASDYILKDRLSRLPSAVNNAIVKCRLIREQTLERLKVNEELATLNHRLNMATKSADIGIWDWDIFTNALKWDAGMYPLYDLETMEFESTYDNWVSRLHPDDMKRINEEIQLAVDGKIKYDTEYRVIGRYDRVLILRATGLVERNAAGVPMRMIGICWDITQRKLEALEKEKIIEEMSRRNAELEQFSYIISHNLRAPLANIIAASNAINDTDLLEEHRAFYNEAVQTSADNLDHIIKDLNQILKIKGGNQTKEHLRYSDLVDSIKVDLSDMLLESDFKITCDFSAVDEMFTVRLFLHSIFLNMMSNSIKYRRKDIKGCLHITSQRLNGKVFLVFEDNGLGLNLEKNKHLIFGLYKRFHNNFPGKGMGLFMVKKQVELLGGTVTVNSIENEGTKFVLEFN